MPKYAANPEPVQRIKTLADLISYLRDELGWPISPDSVSDDLTFDWSADELRLADVHGARLRGGAVRQLRPFVPGQPWGIFLVEFADTQVYRTSLRQILRGLVPGRRRDASLQSWQHENLLFICATADYERFTFAHFKGDKVHRARLATFGWRKGSAYLRTLIEHNLPYLAWPKDDGADPNAWHSEWARAFDKEPVTRKFFDDFNNTFRKVCNDIANRHSRWSKETVEREAQTLLNRLLFLYFIQRKGWLNRDRQYLVNQFREYYRKDPTGISFLKDFLQPLFVKLSTKSPQADIPGHDLPFLNGGLFADEYGSEQRDDEVRRHHELKVGNDTFQHIFDDLLEAYNFTVREDTPLDVDVAIDPEMLGKIFESLVLQLEQSEVGGKSSRHDTGSYYTPRPIVHYLCRDALAAWLADQPPFADGARTFLSAERGAPPDADKNVRAPLAALVSRKSQIENLLALDASQGLDQSARATLDSLLTPEQARALADALRELRACDLAVGSGAFPVALLHELVNVARLAETRARGKDPAANDPRWLFDTKTRFIERVLYGVDIQARAIEICKLRLWLSLVVDYPLDVDVDTCEKQSFRDSLKRLPALPNLDFKIRRANSLIDTIHGEPVPLGKLHASDQARVVLSKLTTAKREFYRADSVPEKRKLRFAIYAAMAELAQIELTVARNELGLLPDPENAGKVAELDQGQKAMAKVLGQIRDARKMKAADQDDALERIREFFDDEKKPTFVWQLDFAEVFHRAGQASLPSFEMAEGGDRRDALAALGGFDLIVGNPPYVRQEKIKGLKEYLAAHFDCYAGAADLYVYFYEQSLRLLRRDGALALISSNSFLNSAFGQKLRCFLKKNTSIRTLIDFAETRVFTSITEPCIFIARKGPPTEQALRVLRWDQSEVPEDVAAVMRQQAFAIPQKQLGEDGWQLESPLVMRLLDKMRRTGMALGEHVNGRFYYGIKTGLNEAFVVDRDTRSRLIAEHKSSADLLKPFLRGRDVKRWRVEFAEQYLITIESSENKAHAWSGKPAKEAEKVFAKTYPAIQQWSEQFRAALIAREDQGHYFWELRSCAYYNEFKRPKILYQEINRTDAYAFDDNGYLTNNKLFMLPEAGSYVLALLNSRTGVWFMHTFSGVPLGGFLALQWPIMKEFPIPLAERPQHDALVALVERILKAKRADGAADTAALEREIDERVYRLYGLRSDEIKLVEETSQ